MATATKVLCVCGVEVTDSSFARQAHKRGKTHRAWLEGQVTVGAPPPLLELGTPQFASPRLDSDLQVIVDLVNETPQMRAKMTRFAFSARGWPNTEHPGTVRDFLVAHNIPIV